MGKPTADDYVNGTCRACIAGDHDDCFQYGCACSWAGPGHEGDEEPHAYEQSYLVHPPEAEANKPCRRCGGSPTDGLHLRWRAANPVPFEEGGPLPPIEPVVPGEDEPRFVKEMRAMLMEGALEDDLTKPPDGGDDWYAVAIEMQSIARDLKDENEQLRAVLADQAAAIERTKRYTATDEALAKAKQEAFDLRHRVLLLEGQNRVLRRRLFDRWMSWWGRGRMTDRQMAEATLVHAVLRWYKDEDAEFEMLLEPAERVLRAREAEGVE